MRNPPTIDCNTDAFRMLRLARGLSLSKLAKCVGIHRTQLARIEAGENLPRVDHAIRIAAVLRAKVESLWTEAA